ncbi:hypothetical protein RAS1_11270 [Phycisphaerae bacterium RAS1]|nr:hypothetical protein RAS1_11270 [Phycisphaerae bacterium RAS1]
MLRALLVAALSSLAGAAPGLAVFVPGRLYVGGQWFKGSLNNDAIVEFDPLTGNSRLFWESPYRRGLIGLEFTPDGSRLRASFYAQSRVFELDGDGNAAQILGFSDGVTFADGMAYAPNGDFYFVNAGPGQIMRIPASGGPPSVFADAADGVAVGSGGIIDFGPSGDLYYARRLFGDGRIYRVNPAGVGTLFHDFPSGVSTASMTIDSAGNLFAMTAAEEPAGGLWRFSNENSAAASLIAPGFGSSPAHLTIRMSVDESRVILAGNSAAFVESVPVGGASAWRFDGYVFVPEFDLVYGNGADVYVPEPAALPFLILSVLVLFARNGRR